MADRIAAIEGSLSRMRMLETTNISCSERSCHSAHGWKEDENGLLHSELNYHKCMQADRRGPPKVGAMLRVFDCDKNNKLQLFEYKDGRLQLRGENLFAAFTGDIGNVNQDPIILKKCNDDTTRWTDYGY
jgi:hypothetical protein